MAFKPGYLGHFSLDNAAGTLTNLSMYIDNVSVPQTVQTLEVSAFGSSAKAFIPGLTDGDTISFSGPYDVAMHTHLTALKAAQSAGTASHSYQWGPGGSVASQAKQTGETILVSYELSTGVGGRSEYSASLQVTGTVTNSTF
jgi:hypothetical protein